MLRNLTLLLLSRSYSARTLVTRDQIIQTRGTMRSGHAVVDTDAEQWLIEITQTHFSAMKRTLLPNPCQFPPAFYAKPIGQDAAGYFTFSHKPR
jgi:hypothetical protein